MKLGYFKLHPILDGFFRLDGGAMFGRVPKETWKKTNPPDRKNRILLSLRCLLIQTGKHNILVDTGIGDKHTKLFVSKYAIDHKEKLIYSLVTLGIGPRDVDIVINTHLHFDHCGGNTMIKDELLIPTFPAARYLVQRGEWREAGSGHLLTRASYLPEDFLPLEYWRKIEFIDDEIFEVEKGITLIKTGGHTKNHLIIKIESEGETAIYLADLVPTVTHLNLPFIMAYDLEPLKTLEKKMEILAWAASKNCLLIFEHDPQTPACYIKIEDKKVSVAKTVNL